MTPIGKKAILCGSGELGKEVALELQRFGVEVIALDKYANAPAMQVAHRSYVLSMLDGERLREIIEKEKPDYIIPEVEAIATPTLVALEKEGYNVIPTAEATLLTMNRKGIRQLAAEKLGIKTSPYRFAATREEFDAALEAIGTPCVVKPIMSSSGHGQSVVRSMADADNSWKIAQEGGRAGGGEVIVEGFVKFDYEITLLTVRHSGGTLFLNPIGHHQVDGDYRESWQPQPMSQKALADAQDIAKKVTDALGGYGIFGVELFIFYGGDGIKRLECCCCYEHVELFEGVVVFFCVVEVCATVEKLVAVLVHHLHNFCRVFGGYLAFCVGCFVKFVAFDKVVENVVARVVEKVGVESLSL